MTIHVQGDDVYLGRGGRGQRRGIFGERITEQHCFLAARHIRAAFDHFTVIDNFPKHGRPDGFLSADFESRDEDNQEAVRDKGSALAVPDKTRTFHGLSHRNRL